MFSTARLLVVFFAVVAGATLIYVCAKYALADYHYERARAIYSNLDAGELNYASELTPVIEQVDRSLMLRGTSANALDFKADMLYQSWWLSPDGQYLNSSKLLQGAESLHFEASKIRKNWSFSVARLALIHSQQRSLEDGFGEWFSKAHQLGVYETRVARSMMLVGLKNWSKLTDQQRTLTVEFVQASIEQKANSPEFIRGVLLRHDKLDFLCSTLNKTARVDAVCKVF